jgi:hypothetical protein
MTGGDGQGPRRSYLRTRDRVIHRAGCFAALGGSPWAWAEGMTAAELAEEPASRTYGQCEYCMPEHMWPTADDPGDPRGTHGIGPPPLLDRIRLAYEHMTRSVELDTDKARWLADQGDLRGAASAHRDAWGWEQTAKVLALYVPEVLSETAAGVEGPAPGEAPAQSQHSAPDSDPGPQTMPE